MMKLKNHKNALILFTSHPVAEASRKPLGHSLAETLKIYRALLTDVCQKIALTQRSYPFDLVIASDKGDLPNLNRIAQTLDVPIRFHFIEHTSTNFDQKFKHALHSTFALGYENVVIIGNDTPDLSPDLLKNAFQQLNNNEAVVGPAVDGGFYLLGLKAYHPSYFENINWCCDSVLNRLLENLSALNFQVAFLPFLEDIDSNTELKAWMKKQRYRSLLLYQILSILLAHCARCFDYTHPFIFHQHISRRIWQLPPPDMIPVK